MTNEEQLQSSIEIMTSNIPAAKVLDEGKKIEVLESGGLVPETWFPCDGMSRPADLRYRPKPEPIKIWLSVYSLDGVDWTGSKYPSKQACENDCARGSHFVRAGCFVEVRE